MIITITLVNGEKLTQTFSSNEVTIGRGQKANFIVRDDALSRIHAKIELINHEFFITDLESLNGVFLDGKRIDVNKRTLFSTFLVLNLGPHECQATETGDNSAVIYGKASNVTEAESIEELSKPTKTTRNINRVALNSQLPRQKKEKETKSNFPLIAVLILGMFGIVAYYQISNKEEPLPAAPEVALETPQPPSPAPEAATPEVATPKIIKNDFYSYEEYEALRLRKSCQEFTEICHAMEISEAENEGLIVENKEAFIFVSPNRKTRNFANLTDKPDAGEIITLSSFLSSSIYLSLKNKEIDQAHVLIQNDELKIIKVFRFYGPEYVENELITGGIRDAIFTGNTVAFWDAFNAQVKSKSFL